MYQRFGTCSNCGGCVTGHVGPWYGITPPAAPSCDGCGWSTERVIRTHPAPKRQTPFRGGYAHEGIFG